MKTSATDEEITSILGILDTWCYVGSYGQPYLGVLTGRFAAGPYRFEVIIKPDLSKVAAPGNGAAREYRAELMRRAENTLDALAEAGWQLTDYPAMEFSGEVFPFGQTLAGELVEPSRQGGIELKVRFSVDRPR